MQVLRSSLPLCEGLAQRKYCFDLIVPLSAFVILVIGTNNALMPSLIYMARVTDPSEKLAQGLQSAGLHIKSFAPGEITADECILVMTSEALASLQPANGVPTAGYVDRGLEGVPPPPKMDAHLGSQAAMWNRLSSAAAKESATSREQPSSVPSNSQKSAETSHPLPVALGRPSAKTANPSLSPPSMPSGEKSRISPAQSSATLFRRASRFGKRSRLVNEPRYKLFWQTVAIAASMLIFATLRPSTPEVITGNTTQSARLDSGSKELRRTVSGTRPQQTELPKAAKSQLRHSDYFVPKDVTNRFHVATLQKSELRRNAQGNVSRKRVVVN